MPPPASGRRPPGRRTRHATYDRVVFTFSGGVPGYTIGYVNEVVSDARGDVVSRAEPGVGFRAFPLTDPYRMVIDVARESLPPFPGVSDITTWPKFGGMQAAFNEGHQPWRGSPLMVVQAWARGHMTNATVSQAGPGTVKVTEPGTGRHAMITGTRPVTVGMARLWVITKISF